MLYIQFGPTCEGGRRERENDRVKRLKNEEKGLHIV